MNGFGDRLSLGRPSTANSNVAVMFLASVLDAGEMQEMAKKICKRLVKGSLLGELDDVLENADENLGILLSKVFRLFVDVVGRWKNIPFSTIRICWIPYR